MSSSSVELPLEHPERVPRQVPNTIELFSAVTSCSRASSVCLRDELSVPTEDRVGCHDPGNPGEDLPAEKLPFHGEASSLIVGETEPSTAELLSEYPVLLHG